MARGRGCLCPHGVPWRHLQLGHLPTAPAELQKPRFLTQMSKPSLCKFILEELLTH